MSEQLKIKSTFKLRTGRAMPVVGLGTWQLDRDTAGTIAAALKFGYPMIDTSGDYGTQPGIGDGIKRSGLARGDFYLTTKIESHGQAYEQVKNNLGELSLDYADMMLIHWPPKSGVGEDLWRDLIRARSDGLTRDIGVSNYSVKQIEELAELTGEMPAVNQIEWTPLGHDQAMLDFCRGNGIIIQAYSPLMRGEHLNHPVISAIAKKHGQTEAQTVLRWNIQLGIAPLPKANSPEHLKENVELFDFELSTEDMAKISSLNEHRTLMWWQHRLPYI